MRPRVAIATCAQHDIDPDAELLLTALAACGVDASMCVWDDASVAWESFDLTVVRSTWDYVQKFETFASWIATTPRLLNRPEALRYSLDKHYLADLASKGVAVIETHFVEVGDDVDLQSGELVVKPAVGAGSLGADRFAADEHSRVLQHVAMLHAEGRCAMIQPYVASVDSLGEAGMVFIDGRFSHAMRKGAMLNIPETDRDLLFRIEQMSRIEAPAGALSAADQVLAASGFADLLYARVDLVEVAGVWSVMELELVEPSLFLEYDADAPSRLADAIARRASERNG